MIRPIAFLSVILFGFFSLPAQEEVVQSSTYFRQAVDASFLKKKVKFRLTASIKTEAADELTFGQIWATVVDKKNAFISYDRAPKEKTEVTPNEWKAFKLEGTMDENAGTIYIGGYCYGSGKFYFDNMELWVENDKGEMQKALLRNPDFETPVTGYFVPDWADKSSSGPVVKVKGYTSTSTNDHVSGERALLIEGKNIHIDSTYIIGSVKGYTPQIGTLVSMLNNLSARVERTVKSVNPKDVDHLFDENANSIGALVMHLAAAEAYYQVYTFEHRGFNEEEKEKWQDALDLGEKARKRFKGKEISYYLEQYREVRKKTLQELAKRNDAWLAETAPGSGFNTYFSWFHVMEHQSSHLGQVLMLKKRLPKPKEKTGEKIVLEK